MQQGFVARHRQMSDSGCTQLSTLISRPGKCRYVQLIRVGPRLDKSDAFDECEGWAFGPRGPEENAVPQYWNSQSELSIMVGDFCVSAWLN